MIRDSMYLSMYLSPTPCISPRPISSKAFSRPEKRDESLATKAIHPAPEADRSLPFNKKLLTNTYRFSDTSIVIFFPQDVSKIPFCSSSHRSFGFHPKNTRLHLHEMTDSWSK